LAELVYKVDENQRQNSGGYIAQGANGCLQLDMKVLCVTMEGLFIVTGAFQIETGLLLAANDAWFVKNRVLYFWENVL
jgi:hypothetical protein